MAVPKTDAARSDAIRAGWVVQPLPGSREFLFAKKGRVFTAAFPCRRQSLRELEQQRALRAAGVSAYVVESSSEWTAVMEFEDRHANR